jgi:hypothetical protein
MTWTYTFTFAGSSPGDTGDEDLIRINAIRALHIDLAR